ncbi:MobA/MobL family protein [Bradyrhizobium sp. 190]|nr:MobA/MobL family protein [Bradyrhizobium sp. 190]
MAIYSLHHSSIGKSTQDEPYTASAHIRYITRARALSRLEGNRMPTDADEAMDYLRKEEDTSRKNARVLDKVMLALPVELDAEQRAALVRSFAEDVTKGRAPWLAAFHDRGKDAKNPHCHLVIRDRDPKTGKRAIGMSEAGSTERLRELWEEHANNALAEAGLDIRIDRRTLEEQGIRRRPTIHEGVRARRMSKEGRTPPSRRRSYRNQPRTRSRSRVVDYRKLDKGLSRTAYNRRIRMERESEKDRWAAIDADRQHREIEDLRGIHRPDLDDGMARGRKRKLE